MISEQNKKIAEQKIQKTELDNQIQSIKNEIALYLAPDMSSMGVSPNTSVTDIREGFDWNKGLTFIDTKDPIILKSEKRDIPKKAIHIFYKNGENLPALCCPCCKAQLRKNDKYCSQCGQRIDTKHTDKMTV